MTGQLQPTKGGRLSWLPWVVAGLGGGVGLGIPALQFFFPHVGQLRGALVLILWGLGGGALAWGAEDHEHPNRAYPRIAVGTTTVLIGIVVGTLASGTTDPPKTPAPGATASTSVDQTSPPRPTSAQSPSPFILDLAGVALTNMKETAADFAGTPHARSIKALVDGASCGATSSAHLVATTTFGGTLRLDVDLGAQPADVSVRVAIFAGDDPPIIQTVTSRVAVPIQLAVRPGRLAIDIDSVSHDDFECGNKEIIVVLIDPRIV